MNGVADTASCMGIWHTVRVTVSLNTTCMWSVCKWFKTNNVHLVLQIWTSCSYHCPDSNTRSFSESFIQSKKPVSECRTGENWENFLQNKAVPSFRKRWREYEGLWKTFWAFAITHKSVHTYSVCTYLECSYCETIFDNIKTWSCHA